MVLGVIGPSGRTPVAPEDPLSPARLLTGADRLTRAAGVGTISQRDEAQIIHPGAWLVSCNL